MVPFWLLGASHQCGVFSSKASDPCLAEFALAFFLVFRTGAALVADGLANRLNPSDIPSGPPTQVLVPGVLLLPGLAALFTGAWMLGNHSPFFPTYSYVLMICAVVGAFNGILMEAEDNQPGGWANPTKKNSGPTGTSDPPRQ